MKTFHLIKYAILIMLIVSCNHTGQNQSKNGQKSTEYYVSKNGSDQNIGSKAKPFLTIQTAANIAQPGDIITVHKGIYRERVNPIRGGNSDAERITYQAAKGEEVVIKGSELIKNWEYIEKDTWKVVIPNEFFRDFNPFNDIIHGEWYATPLDGYNRHTGAVYLNEEWLSEAFDLDTVLQAAGEDLFWFAEVNAHSTIIWAQFKGVDPNKEQVEINVRQSIFYPDQPGRNFITVCGFIMRQAAAPWAGAMSEQVALLGTHWSKGWIIENNVISHSMNAGITLGLCDLSQYGVKIPSSNAVGYTKFTSEAIKNGWTKENIGSHIVRNNLISHCEKNGIHGSLGGSFSTIEGNEIHTIAKNGWVNGPDIGAIKLLGGVDSNIRDNLIYNFRGRGIWLDWMGQGSIIQANIIFDTQGAQQAGLYLEVNHGPILVANNIVVSPLAFSNRSRGSAYAHNLFIGQCVLGNTTRKTPYLEAHSTSIAGMHDNYNGDDRYYNNIFLASGGITDTILKPEKIPVDRPIARYDDETMPVVMEGNLYLNGAVPIENDTRSDVLKGQFEDVNIIRKEDGEYIEWSFNPEWTETRKHMLVSTEMLGKAKVPDMKYEFFDGTPIKIDVDYFGRARNMSNPLPGPFSELKEGKQLIKIWPR